MTLFVILTAMVFLFCGWVGWIISRWEEPISDEEAARRYQEYIIRRGK